MPMPASRHPVRSFAFPVRTRSAHRPRTAVLPRLHPVSAAVASLALAGSLAAPAHAQQAFSPAWFAAKGAAQSAAATTGRLPSGLPASALTSSAQQSAAARQKLQTSIENLSLAAQAIAAQQAAQRAAREAALANGASVPDGLAEGGLKVDTGSLTAGWLNARDPVQTVADGKTTVTIEQTADKAILNWETFNVGKQTTVDFKQDTSWAALNRVNDPLARPSQIQGRIKADGTILVVNRNGIVFAGSSQVDARNLAAAAAAIDDAQFRERGLYNGGNPVFGNAAGAVRVEAGAQLRTATPANSTTGGGYVLLLGRDVENAGTIDTPKGQALLAAGDTFAIVRGQATEGDRASTTRGNQVTVGVADGGDAGTVVNKGLIQAASGDVTMLGREVAQAGVAVATTSVDARGTVHLGATGSQGRVTLGKDGVTAILLEEGGSTALDGQRDSLQAPSVDTGTAAIVETDPYRRDLSLVEITSGGGVDFEGGSLTLATGGQIGVQAGTRALVRDGAKLDVSGAIGVKVAMEANNLRVNVQGNEQRDAPVNRDGNNLNNSDVWVDRRSLVRVPAGNGYDSDRWYTAGGLLEVGGYLANVGRGVGEWMAQGGTVSFTGGEVVTQAGSRINLSGGTLDVQSGYINQSWLRGADGQLYVVDRAPGDILYQGLYRGYEDAHARWGGQATQYYRNPLIAPERRYENGYVVGRDAGALVIGTRSAVLEGELLGSTYQGERQTQAAQAGVDGYYQSQTAVARGAALIVGSYRPYYDKGSGMRLHALGADTDTAGAVVLSAGQERVASGLDLDTALAEERKRTLYLDTDMLSGFGLGAVKIAAVGGITVDGELAVGPAGEITLFSPQVRVNANLVSRGGSIQLGDVLRQATNGGQIADTTLYPPAGVAAGVVVADGVTLDTRGLWSNLLRDPADITALAYRDGGRVAIRSSSDIKLAAASLIDVSSGAALSTGGDMQAGKGGSVTLQAGANAARNGRLTLDGGVLGLGVAGGGTLAIATGQAVTIGEAAEGADRLVLAPERFQSGFSRYEVNGLGGVDVADGTQLDVLMPVYRLARDGRHMPNSAGTEQALERWLPPLHQDDPVRAVLTRRAGASLLLASGTDVLPGGTLAVGRGAVVTVDPGQSIEFGGKGQITIDGRLNAWGGRIAVRKVEEAGYDLNTNTRSVWIGPEAVLDVAGRAWVAEDVRGRRYGTVQDGGSIEIGGALDWEDTPQNPNRPGDRYLIVRPGALLEASGASAVFDVDDAGGAPGSSRALTVAGDGGSIILRSANGMYLDGTMRAAAGGEGASGGTLGIAFDGAYWLVQPDAGVLVPRQLTLVRTQGGSELAPDLRPGEAGPGLAYGHARLGVDRIEAGGFDHLSLLAGVRAESDLGLAMRGSLRLYGDLGMAAAAAPGATLSLSAPYMRFAQTNWYDVQSSGGTILPRPIAPRDRGDRLVARAELIDVRDDVDFAGFADVALESRGDIRLLPNLYTAPDTTGLTSLLAPGRLSLTAAQVYPATGANAAIAVGQPLNPAEGGFNPDGTLIIRGQGGALPEVPHSAFGRLSLLASRIEQGGVVRAPLGMLAMGSIREQGSSRIEFLPGSLTSVSGAGLVMPYGGTVDGLTYEYAGKKVVLDSFLGAIDSRVARGIQLTGLQIVAHEGAVLDLSGGGELRGAGFISGRGGSVDVLRAPLAVANPVSYAGISASGNAVYAILPGYGNAYAPVQPDAPAGTSALGRQVTIPPGVPGLPAGTYTLLPATYALLPGAFRVEIGAPAPAGGAMGVATLRSGSYATAGTLGVAHTGAQGALPSSLILTPADVVRAHSQYNETGYEAFVLAEAQRRGVQRALVPSDGRTLDLMLADGAGLHGTPALVFEGEGRFAARAGSEGFGGGLSVRASSPGRSTRIEILADGQAPVGTHGVALYASGLNAFEPVRMSIGGLPTSAINHEDNNGQVLLSGTNGASHIVLRSGATLSAPEVFLAAGNDVVDGMVREQGSIVIEQGGSINTLGRGAPALDAGRLAYVATGALAVSNGWVNMMMPASATDTVRIDVGSCVSACAGQTTLYSEGTIAVATNGAFTLAEGARYGARNLVFGVASVNLGSTQALAAAAAAGALPPGMTLNQTVLADLLSGNTSIGVPALETLVLNARESVNLFGPVELDTRAAGASSVNRLVVGAPAFYGYGAAGDRAVISTGEFIWTGAVPAGADGRTGDTTPAAPGGAMRDRLGQGSLDILADRIVFGHGPQARPSSLVSADRLALGFAAVNLNAGERITSQGKSSLAVYRDQGDYVAGQGWQYSGGDLNLHAPLITGEAGSSNRLTAGGSITLAGTGAAPGSADALGAELTLTASAITVDTAVALPSGKLTLRADGDIVLGDTARLDLSGRAVPMFDVTRYSWGGDLVLESRGGNISTAAGSMIDLSADNHHGGTLAVTALDESAGHVALSGAILGGATGRYDAGGTIVPFEGAELTLRAQTLDDFAGLNARLNEGEVYGARRFQLKQGDLVVGEGVRARTVQIVADGGSLTVDGRIDASGFQVGTIRLAAQGDLVVNGMLDAHGTGLRVDSHGKIIDSPNRAIVELTSRAGTLVLGEAAGVDLRAGTDVPAGPAAGQHDGAPRGTLSLNARRLGGTGVAAGSRGSDGADDVALEVAGAPDVRGARLIAVNAFRAYDDAPVAELPDVSGSRPQLITQQYLDEIDADSVAFIDAALANADLAARLARLGNARLRPGVEILSNAVVNPEGNLTVSGDLDLSGHRYGPDADRIDASRRGHGEPGVLVLRAAGGLSIHGSINDGFAPPPDNPDEQDNGWVLTEGRNHQGQAKTPYGGDIVVPIDGVTLEAGTEFQAGVTLNYDIPVRGATLPAGTVLPVQATLSGSLTLPAGIVLEADITAADGTVFKAGTVLGEPLSLEAGARLAAGTRLRAAAAVQPLVWPKGVALPAVLALRTALPLARGAVIPAMTMVELPGDQPVDLRPSDAGGRVNRRNWAVAPMLPEGATSWDLTLVAGADLASADRRALNAAGRGDIVLADTHYGLRGKTTITGGTITVTQLGAERGLGDYSGELVGKTKEEIEQIAGGRFEDILGYSFEDFCLNAGWCATAGPTVTQLGAEHGLGDYSGELIGKTKEEIEQIAGGRFEDILGYSFEDFCRNAGWCEGGGGTPTYSYSPVYPLYSVLRTGAGDLELVAGRDVRMDSVFGVYTAGAPTSLPGGSAVNDAFNLPRGVRFGTDSVLGTVDDSTDYSASLAAYQAWYPGGGGNVRVAAGRDVIGDTWGAGATSAEQRDYQYANYSSAAVGNWLWRQGSGDTAGVDPIATSWWINFGTYVNVSTEPRSMPRLVGFTGIGALGGGNVVIDAGRHASVVDARGDGVLKQDSNRAARSQGLVVAVGSTGRVVDGELVLTGGGDLAVKTGGAFNANLRATMQDPGTDRSQHLDLNGVLVNLRGSLALSSGAIGGINVGYGSNGGGIRPDDLYAASGGLALGGPVLVLGDAVARLETRGDLVLGAASDPGRVGVPNTTPWTWNGTPRNGQGVSWFSLWTDHTAVDLFAAGGNLTPTQLPMAYDGGSNAGADAENPDYAGGALFIYPSILRATAAGGDISLGDGIVALNTGQRLPSRLMLAPSPRGQLELLAGGSIYGKSGSGEGHGYSIGLSGADAPLPVPAAPAFAGYTNDFGLVLAQNLSSDGFRAPAGLTGVAPLFAFGPGTPVNRALHAGDPTPARFYAVQGDIVRLDSGGMPDMTFVPSAQGARSFTTWYEAGAPVWLRAGTDVLGARVLAAHSNSTDISLVEAGRDIIYADVKVGGPGTLEVSAGRHIRLEDRASVRSIGPMFGNDRRPGASVALMAGQAAGVDWEAVADRYLDPRNVADADLPLADQPGKVAKTYERELAGWLADRYATDTGLRFADDGAPVVFDPVTMDAGAFFARLAPEQQRIFLREVYYAELRAGGREYNDAGSRRHGSYLRGRNMIATLFPGRDADAEAPAGDIILYGGSGVRTDFGGDIELLAPHGRIVVGVEGTVPPASAGLMTQGAGDVRLYSQGSVLLGLSRVMTTFGGDILAWSAQGDINAGRGAKTTVLYTPPRRAYDQWGNVIVAPQVPSSGAGIATLAPIPEVPPGDVDLIAPLGTIDAGEAGIRVSGNVNIAALRVVNAENIQVQGKATGLPVTAAVNVAALSNASAAASQATVAAQEAMQRERAAARQALPSVFTVRVIGFGNEPGPSGPEGGNRAEPVSQGMGEMVELVGRGRRLSEAQLSALSAEERRRFGL